jgi:cytochrome P450
LLDANADPGISLAEWTELALKPFVYRFIATLSSRVFFGVEVCNNEEWLDIAVAYTQDSFMAHRILRTWNPILRPFVHWFVPECRRVRAERTKTRQIAEPIVKSRLKERAANGGVSARTADMIGWLLDMATAKKTTVRMEDAQLFLSVAATHTTTETLSYVMLDLLSHPTAIPKLKEEMINVLKEGGWKKSSLGQMKLLDSVLKESQRLHPISLSMVYPLNLIVKSAYLAQS